MKHSIIYQTDFRQGQGNALQACVASILCKKSIDDVPNFIEFPDYFESIKNFCKDKGFYYKYNDYQNVQEQLIARKIQMNDNGILEEPLNPNQNVIIRGKSPRGDYGHVVVGCVNSDKISVQFIHDPHPEATMLSGYDNGKGWCMIFE